MDKKPKCIIVTGRPGAGKSTLAKKLTAHLYMPLISRDEIKEGYVNTYGIEHNQLPPETNGVVSDFFFEIVFRYLAGKVSIVIEAAFQHHVWEPRMAQIEALSEPFIVICSIDGVKAEQRHRQRRLNNPQREFYHGDKLVSVSQPLGKDEYLAPKFDVSTVEVLTEGAYSPSVEEIKKMIQPTEKQS